MAMFTLPQMISRLTKGFVKFTGRKPDGLEKIKIKQEALERIKQQDKVVDMEGNVIDTSKGIMGGRQIKKAMGGRIGLKAGMNRRTFLKLMGGVGAGIGALKTGLLKLAGKGAVSQAAKEIIKTDPVPGKPAWFDALVTKVINEGTDVTKTFATGERQSVYQKKLGKNTVVRVTQDIDDGAIRVEYESPDNVFGDTVQLQYRKQLPDEGNPNPSAEFTTAESGPVGRQVGPDDYDMDIDEVGGNSIKDLDSDLTKLKIYATGKKPTLKEFVQSKNRKDKAQRITEDPEAQSDAIVRRQGEMLDYDVPDDAFASGGLAGMLGE